MMQKKNLCLILSGNILEYFDLSLYTAFATVIAMTFIPFQNDAGQLFYTFLILAVTFLARPIGSILFGYIGDTWGRSKSLTYSILGMSLATICIGLLPSYETVGLLAPLGLLVCRAMQGICVGGEGQGAAVYALERFSNIKPGFLGASVTATNVFGSLVAAITAVLLSTHTNIDVTWRYPFIIAGIIGLSSSYLRSYLVESYQGRHKDEALSGHSPLGDVFRDHQPALVMTFLLGGIASALSQTVIAFFNLYFVKAKGYPASTALFINILGIIVYLGSLLIAGIYADRVGILKSLKQFLWIIIPLLPICFYGLESDINTVMLTSVIGIAFLTGCIGAPTYPVVVALFPISVRYTGVCFGFNTGIALLGGTFPMIITSFMASTGSLMISSLYLVGLSLCCLFLIRRYALMPLSKNIS